MTFKQILGLTASAALLSTTALTSAHARDNVQVAGSSTVLLVMVASGGSKWSQSGSKLPPLRRVKIARFYCFY